MELIRGLHNLQPEHRSCVATIGNFDGVHLGHQAVIGELAEKGQELGLPTVAMIFEPQPLENFRPDQAPARLSRLREKLKALSRFALDRVVCVSFNSHFADLSADEFIQSVLVDGLGVRYLVIGDDFRFGKGRTGDVERLKIAGRVHGFEVDYMRTFSIDGERVSSTLVRQALLAGDLNKAEKLLGRPYRMCGRVAHGHKIGREIGIPTANIHLHRKVTPVHGIFVVEVFGVAAHPWPGVASVGSRPTIGGTQALLEVHLFDFDQDIYGKHINIDFLHRLRDEKKFDSMGAMVEKIHEDIARARAWFDIPR